MARVEDRWLKRDRKTRTAEYGKGMRWRVVWEEPGGQQRKKSFASKDAAEYFLTSVSSDLHTGEYHPLTSGVMTLGEWSHIWMKAQAHQRPQSMAMVETRTRINIISTLGETPLRDLTRTLIQDAVAVWGETLAPSTIKLTFTYLSGMLKLAVDEKQIKANPCLKVKLPPVERSAIMPLTVDQVERIYSAMVSPYRLPVIVAAASGLRPSELFGLTWDRVDLDRGVLTVDRQLTGRAASRPEWGPLKTKYSYRTVQVGAVTVEHLRRQAVSGSEGLVFNDRGFSLTRTNRSDMWRSRREKLPWMGDGWHQLRHHHASLLIAAGMSPVAVAHRLGHKDATETLRTYAHLWPTDDARMAAATDGLVGSLERGTPQELPGGVFAQVRGM